MDVLAEPMRGAPEQVDPERAAGELARELARLLVDPLVLSLDDAETLERSPAALAVVGRLVGGGSTMLRLAAATRRPLGLRVAEERAAGRVTELGPAELAFSAADCEAYLRLVRGSEPLPAEVDSLMEETEGWPLGVVLAGTGAEPRGPSRPRLDARTSRRRCWPRCPRTLAGSCSPPRWRPTWESPTRRASIWRAASATGAGCSCAAPESMEGRLSTHSSASS